MRGILLCISLWGLICAGGFAQISQEESSPDTELDTVQVYEKKNSFTSVFYGQPGRAVLYSFVLPGAGQLYNKRWWKVPLVWAGEGYLVYNLSQKINTFQARSLCYSDLINNIPTSTCGQVTDANSAFDILQSAKSQKEQAWLFLIIGHLIQSFEAFIDRHLINFNTSEDLGYKIPDASPLLVDQSAISLQFVEIFTLRIPLNGK